MEQLTAMLEGMTTRFMSGDERADKEKLAGHVSTLRTRDVEGLWLELKEITNAPREMQERIKMLEEALHEAVGDGDDWWCPVCQEALSGGRVTNGGRCDTCGTFIEYQTPEWITKVRALLATPSTIN